MAPAVTTAPHYEDYAAPLDLIRRDGYFAVRGMKLDPDHVKALAGRIRTIGALDPVLLWEGSRGFVVLDGAHRVAAYGQAGWPERVPARIVHCDRREALLLAVQANSKLTLALSNSERWNLAWRLVREADRAGAALFSKRQIVETTGTSKGLVDKMRAALVAFIHAGKEPTGNWIMDRAANASGDWTDMNDEEEARIVEEVAKDLRKTLNVRGVRNDQLLAMALHKAVGDHRLRGWLEFLYADDGEGEDADGDQTDF